MSISEIKSQARDALYSRFFTYLLPLIMLMVISYVVNSVSSYISGILFYKEFSRIQEDMAALEPLLNASQSDFQSVMAISKDVFNIIFVGADGDSKIVQLIFMYILISFLINAFVILPFGVGMNKCMCDLNEDKKLDSSAMIVMFSKNYISNVKILALKQLAISFASLFFVLPGIYLHYKWYFVEYIIANNPELSNAEVFEKNAELMQDKKTQAFMLELSFIGWFILCMLVPLAIIFVAPYYFAARTEFYLQNDYELNQREEMV